MKMAVLSYLSYVSALAAFTFITLSLASGLLYIAELIEENSARAKVIGMRTIYTILTLHAILYFTDSLPLKHTLFSMFCHVVYLQNFSATWPFISLTSPSFLGSCVLVITDHFVWFIYFTSRVQNNRTRAHKGSSYRPRGSVEPELPTFGQMASFFAVCVWLVPLFLFLSLSANDNALPTSGVTSTQSNAAGKAAADTLPRRSILGSLFGSVFDLLPRAGRRRSEGLIAPAVSHPTPRRAPSPMPISTLNDAPMPSPSLGAPPRSPGAPPRSPSRSSFETRADSSAFGGDFRLTSPPRPISRSVTLSPDSSLHANGMVGLGLRPRSPVGRSETSKDR